jgi:hypothetical protein
MGLEENPKWTDQDLYDAYLLGCEDDCIPNPKTKEQFIGEFNGQITHSDYNTP